MSKGNATKPAVIQTSDDKMTFVARDNIWKNHIQKMEYAAKKWPENWGFLNGKVENVNKIIL